MPHWCWIASSGFDDLEQIKNEPKQVMEMAVEAHVSIEPEIGKAGDMTWDVHKVEGVKSADMVTASCGVIIPIEAADFDALAAVVKQVHSAAGIRKTPTRRNRTDPPKGVESGVPPS